MHQYELKFNLKIKVGHSDLYVYGLLILPSEYM